ncbi:hypothetical protein J4221_06315 [Candidatus Pacearchaeota archaeon]|nr:hypothetical protein [Candidatus Pacearchaeota archaeon]
MAEKDRVYKGKFKQGGIFSFKDFYEFLYDYLMDENYDIFEDKYVEKLKGESKNLEIKWTATKEVSDYFRFELNLYWIVLDLKKVKVKKNGEEIVMDSGIIEVKFDAFIVKDYEHRWESHPFWKFLRGAYDRYIIKSRADDYEINLFKEVTEIIAQAKSFLATEGQYSS